MKEKVVLVTGAGSGMGKAVAIMAAERGAKVAVSDISEETAQAVVDEITTKDGQAIAVKCDVSKDAEVKAMIDRTVEEYGRLDAAFNNAGIMMPVTNIDEVSEELYDRVMNINLKGV